MTRRTAEIACDRTCKLAKESLNEIEPGAVNEREGEFEPAARLAASQLLVSFEI